ncbi:MAG: tRNA pseudouridine(13) synthase TruD [Planctomycetes bacterium]|nr:tRNA pseudouridine(13) synthase TruD [Planctomycetota bacterium]
MNPEPNTTNQTPIGWHGQAPLGRGCCCPSLPYLTTNIAGIGGTIKTIPADFVVEEIPQYEFSGEGTHVYALIQKKNMSTQNMMNLVARHVGIRTLDVGYAGRKDARAITRQWISIEHIDPVKLAELESPKLKILDITRHTNKLKVGHLKGNRFTIRLRNLSRPIQEAVPIAEQIMEILSIKGVPNYFGPQRFGYRGDSHLLGQAVIKKDTQDFFDVLLGWPELFGDDEFTEARQLYEQGLFEEAFYKWHSAFGDHRKALKTLIRLSGNTNRAFRQFDKRMLRLYVAAWQSDLFNRVLAARMPDIDTILDGDMAYKHANGASFCVEDAAAEQPRCDTFDISPTGPLIGNRMAPLTGPAGELENPLLDAVELTEDDHKRLKKFGGVGGRRPFRFRPEQTKITPGTDEHGDYLELHFNLPSGCYATVLLNEITK